MAHLGLRATTVAVLCAVVLATTTACRTASSGDGSAEGYPSESISIMAPGSVGGGWDACARAMQRALTEGGLTSESVDVYNVEGAAGTIGLSQFSTDNAGDPYQYMWFAPTLVGGIILNDSPVDLTSVTPIARTHTGFRGIVVDAESDYDNFEQLATDWKADPRSFSWGGGSAGGSDHLMIGSLAQSIGIDPEDINYVPTAGGGEFSTSILSGSVSAGAADVVELVGQVEAGEMKLLAVSSPDRILDAPTFEELGYTEVAASSWFGIVAPGEISDAERDAMVELVEEMLETDEWQETLTTNSWTDFLLTGDEFDAFLEEEQAATRDLLTDLGLVK